MVRDKEPVQSVSFRSVPLQGGTSGRTPERATEAAARNRWATFSLPTPGSCPGQSITSPTEGKGARRQQPGASFRRGVRPAPRLSGRNVRLRFFICDSVFATGSSNVMSGKRFPCKRNEEVRRPQPAKASVRPVPRYGQKICKAASFCLPLLPAC